MAALLAGWTGWLATAEQVPLAEGRLASFEDLLQIPATSHRLALLVRAAEPPPSATRPSTGRFLLTLGGDGKERHKRAGVLSLPPLPASDHPRHHDPFASQEARVTLPGDLARGAVWVRADAEDLRPAGLQLEAVRAPPPPFSVLAIGVVLLLFASTHDLVLGTRRLSASVGLLLALALTAPGLLTPHPTLALVATALVATVAGGLLGTWFARWWIRAAIAPWGDLSSAAR